MDDNLKKVKKLIALMKKEGILSLKQGDIELTLSPLSIQEPALAEPILSDTPSTEEAVPVYTDEEILFWSAPGLVPEKANH